MVVGNLPEAADFVVVGAGPGGYEAALHAARAGRRVMLIDREGEAGAGGICLRLGCIPSKALIEVADLTHRAASSEALGVPCSDGDFDMGRFQIWKRALVDGLGSGVLGQLREAGVDIVAGTVTLTDPNTLVISTPDKARFVQFKSLVLATGSTPTPLPGLPFDGTRILDSSALLGLAAVPKSLAVVGGGYIGLELGTAMAKLGAAVTIVEAEDRLLPTLDPLFAGALERRLAQLRIRVLLGARATGADEHTLAVTLRNGKTEPIPAEKILVAVGRQANISKIGLEVLSPRLERGVIAVDGDRRLSPHVAAIGDITPGPALAHKASAEAPVAVAALCGGRVAFEPAAIPAIVFSDPEIASAGPTLAQAQAAGIDALATRVPLAACARAATLGSREGFAQMVHERGDGTILGVHLAGPHASELIAEGVLAIEMGATVEDLALVIHPHPTLSEQLAELARRGNNMKRD